MDETKKNGKKKVPRDAYCFFCGSTYDPTRGEHPCNMQVAGMTVSQLWEYIEPIINRKYRMERDYY